MVWCVVVLDLSIRGAERWGCTTHDARPLETVSYGSHGCGGVARRSATGISPLSSLIAVCCETRIEPSPGVYFWDLPSVFHVYPACISSPHPWYPAVSLYLAILQQIHCIPLSRCIPLYPAVSVRVRVLCTVHCRYLAVYLVVSRCISTRRGGGIRIVSPTASKTGYSQKYTPGEG